MAFDAGVAATLLEMGDLHTYLPNIASCSILRLTEWPGGPKTLAVLQSRL